MKKTVLPLLGAMLLTLSNLTLSAHAGTVSGTVTTTDKQVVAGAMISLLHEDQKQRLTVYADDQGRFRLTTTYTGKLFYRIRAPFFADQTQTITLEAETNAVLNPVMQRLISKDALSDSLTASAHAVKLKWSDSERKTTFISQCHYCHQMGNELTRQPHDEDEWIDIIERMEGYFTVITPWDKEVFKKTLAAGFDGEPITAEPQKKTDPATAKIRAKARFEEWQVGDGMSFIHDTEVGSDGRLYGVDQGHDVVWELDRKTGAVKKYQMPDSHLPEGGLYSGAQLPIGIFTGKHSPHSLAEDNNGIFWITGSLSSTLLSFDIKTKKYKVYEIGEDALYPHTIRYDKKKLVWFTLPASNQVGRFDPETKKFTLIQLPANGFFRWMTDALFPTVLKIASWFPKENTNLLMSHHWWTGLGRKILNFPYGIDIHPETGVIWYSKLYAGKIGRIDPVTLEVKEFDTPMSGPRRLRFDKDGILWIPSFNEGGLMRFDPATKAFTTYKLPELGPGQYEVPYALNIHPETNEVWITTNQSDRILRFDPKTQKFTDYPSPTRVTFLRDIVFTQDGKVCASNSNLPAYAIEGGHPVMMCLDPEAGSKK